MDREKVIRAVESCFDYWLVQHRCLHPLELENVQELKADTLVLLKEQEPVKPVNVRWEMGINGGNCPKCMNWVQRSYNYCPFCGKAVKWDA